MKKIYFYLFAFLYFSVNSYSQQEPDCGTIETPESRAFYENNKERLLQYENDYFNNPQSRLSMTSIPVKAHVIRTTSGTGGLTVSQLNNAISAMNVFYANSNMQFYLCDGINYINNSTYYYFIDTDEDVLTNTYGVDGLINIYFAETVTRASSGSSLCGYAYYPGGSDTIVMKNDCATNGSTLSHEMGHFFNLRHTHGGTPNELVDGSNCTTEGDYLCDTPADPTLTYSTVNTSCIYTGNETDANGDTYMPDVRNLMSYSRKECRTLFSPQQYARIYASFQTTRNYFTCPSFNVGFIADNTQTCEETLTVNFTDSSVGATSWEWDVDGDDIVDYASQNPTHTYTSSGYYDVSLTIYNGSSSITTSKSEYISIGANQNIPLNRDFDLLTNLESDGWKAETTTGYTWNLNSGTTGSSGTGPSGDNSNDGSGQYIYTEATGFNTNDVAEYTSSCIQINSNDAILQFSYHMYGSTMGELHVDIDAGAGFVNDVIPAIIGQQQTAENDAFIDQQIDLSAYAGETIVVRFRAIRGPGFQSDMAIDDIKITGTLSVNEFDVNNITIYPNPVNGNMLNVKLRATTSEVSYIITNMLGQKLTQGKVSNEAIDVSNLASGSYFLSIDSNGKTSVKRFVKM